MRVNPLSAEELADWRRERRDRENRRNFRQAATVGVIAALVTNGPSWLAAVIQWMRVHVRLGGP